MPKKGVKKTGRAKRGQNKKAEPMPGLIFHHEELPHEEPQQPLVHSPHDTTARHLTWAGAIGVFIFIAFFWGWSFQLRATAFSWKDSAEGQLANKAKTDWNQIYEQTKNDVRQKELTKIKISQILSDLVKIQTTASTTATGTIAATTSTPTTSTKK